MFNLFSKRKNPDPFADSLLAEQQDAWRIAGLLTACITKKKLTCKQEKELNEWLELSDANVKLFETVTDEKFIAATKELFNLLYDLQLKSKLSSPSFSNN